MAITFRGGEPAIGVGTFNDNFRGGEPYPHVVKTAGTTTVSMSQITNWDQREPISKSQISDWNIREPIAKDQQIDWYVNWSIIVTKDSTIDWGLGGLVTTAQETNWVQRTFVSAGEWVWGPALVFTLEPPKIEWTQEEPLAATPPISELVDDFDGLDIDYDIWTDDPDYTSSIGGGSFGIEDNKLVLEITGEVGGSAYITSLNSYTLYESSAYFQLDVTDPDAGYFEVSFYSDTVFEVSPLSLSSNAWDFGGTTAAYDPVDHAWVRISQETDNDIVVEGSPDGSTWAEILTYTGATVSWDDIEFGFYISGAPNKATIDNLNTPPADLTEVDTDQIVNWDVREAVSEDSSVIAWGIYETVSTSVTPAWDIYQFVSDDNEITWSLETTVSTSQATNWDIRESIDSDHSIVWDVQSFTGVSSSATINFMIYEGLSVDNSIDWDILESITTDSDQVSWTIRQGVNASQNTVWGISQSVTQSQSSNWQIRSALSKSQAASWQIREALSTGTTPIWNIREFVDQDAVVDWTMDGLLAVDYEIDWEVFRTIVPRDRDVIGVVTDIDQTVLTDDSVNARIDDDSIRVSVVH